MIGRLHHVVIDCPDPAAIPRVIELGARPLGDEVFADPAGHPFCLIPRPAWAPPVSGPEA
jgi:hypothetical protein